MKLTKKIIAVFLSILTLFSICTVALPVFATDDTSLVTDGSVAEEEFSSPDEESPEPEIISEIREKREENIKHFKLSDGSFVVAQYNNPVHYQDDNGEWIDIDNTITETDATTEQTELFGTEELYSTNKAVDNVVFAEKSNSNTLVAYEAKDHPISLNYQSAKKSNIKIIENNEDLTGNDAFLTLPNVTQEVIYEDVFKDVDLQYIVSSVELKENIILKSKSAQNSFTVNYSIGELTAEVIDEQTINLMADNEIVYTISAPYMVDSNGERSEAITLNVDKNKNGKLSINIVADSSWLQAEERVYPVTVDPTIKTETTQSAVNSVFVANSSAYANRNFNDRQEMLVGRETDEYGYCHSLFKFELPQLKKGDMVVAAELNVTYYSYNAYASTTPDMQVNAHMLKGSWSKSSVTWNNCPSYSSTVLDYEFFGRTLGVKTFDVTTAVKQWYETPDDNYGILLKSADESGDMAVNGFKAAIWTERYNAATGKYPYMCIVYRNNKGLEDYWSYTTLSAGTAGTAYINDYTGNLVFIHGDVATTGLLMPVSLEHVYNGYMADKNASTYPHSGRGNKLSLQQTVKATDISGYPYVYEDGDGTQHYFYKDGSKYLDEDGLNLELKVLSGGGYTVTDKADNVMTFNSSGLLTKISDAEGRNATLTYATEINTAGNDKPFLKTITDGAGHKITLTYNTGASTANNCQLTAITGPDGKVIRYYTSDGKRSKVTYPDGTSSTYTYDSEGSLISATSSDGYKLTFTYVNEDGAKRVRSVVESVTKNNVTTTGQTIKFSYDKVNQTIIRTSGNDSVYRNDDDIRTVYQFDNWGRTISAKSTLGDGTNLGAEKYDYTTGTVEGSTDIGKRNRISAGVATGKYINNLLLNHSFENSGNWEVSHWYSETYTDNGTATFDTSQKYLGSKSVKIKINTATATGGLSMVQYVTDYVSSGTYTLSAYVKTDSLVMGTGSSVGGACVAARIVNSDGSITRKYSRMLLGSTDTGVDNGWQRIHLTFDIPSGATDVRVVPMVYNATGTAYFDCMQLEKNSTVNSYNLLENSSFENGTTAWTAKNTASSDKVVTDKKNSGSKSFKIVGAAGNDKYIRQNINVSGTEKDTYILSGYALANSKPFETGTDVNFFEISVRINYSDGSKVYKRPTFFNYAVSDWQYATGIFTLSDNTSTEKTPTSIYIYCQYNRQVNNCYFDDISLIKEPVPTYSYDSKGNLVSATENAQKNANLSYDTNDNLASFKDERNAQYTYTYADSGNKHRLLTATNNASGVKYAYSYYGSDKGNNLRAQEIQNSTGSVIIRTGIVYTPEEDGIAEGAYVYRDSDQHANSTYYTYDKKSGLLKKVKNAKGGEINYTYDETNGNLTGVSSEGNTVSYAYDSSKTRLTGITHNGFNYNFDYDVFGNVLTTQAAGNTLMTNTYGAGNGLLNKSTYGNDDYVNYVYDSLGRTTRVNKNGSNAYYWRYNANGDTAMHADYLSDRVYYYTYDSLGRIVAETEKTQGADEYRFSNNYAYDASNNLTKLVNTADGLAVTTKYYYDAANRPSKSYLNAYVDHAYSYDSLGRLYQKTINTKKDPITVTYTYRLSDRNENGSQTYRTTQLGWEKIENRTYGYEYDVLGNITKITVKEPGATSYSEKVSYTYDDLGQLIREDNLDLNQTIVYTYDAGGNIASKRIYGYTTTAELGVTRKRYLYFYDPVWKDKLVSIETSVNNNPVTQDISYDEIGNPLTYRDSMSFTWQGRQMKTANLNGTSVSYKYNADGLRTYKKVGSTVHEYEYSGDKLFYEKRGDIKFYYRYDVNGNLMSITRLKANGDKFTLYAICNSRGDVEELRKEDGTLYARYVYDTWGNTIKIIDASGTEITEPANLAKQNPFRYRGYYFDTESGLYYLQSRYYDPVTGRFVNGDSIALTLVSTGSVADKNLYAYCDNNPVTRSDSCGGIWQVALVGAAVGGALEIATQLIENGGKIKSLTNVGIAAVAGGLSASLGVVGGAVVDGVASAAMDIVKGERDMGILADSFVSSAATSIVTGYYADGISKVFKNDLLNNMSGRDIKQKVRQLYPEVKGNEVNKYKTFEFVEKNIDANFKEKLTAKITIRANTSAQTIGFVLSIGQNVQKAKGVRGYTM